MVKRKSLYYYSLLLTTTTYYEVYGITGTDYHYLPFVICIYQSMTGQHCIITKTPSS